MLRSVRFGGEGQKEHRQDGLYLIVISNLYLLYYLSAAATTQATALNHCMATFKVHGCRGGCSPLSSPTSCVHVYVWDQQQWGQWMPWWNHPHVTIQPHPIMRSMPLEAHCRAKVTLRVLLCSFHGRNKEHLWIYNWVKQQRTVQHGALNKCTVGISFCCGDVYSACRTFSQSLKCSGAFPAWDCVWMGAGISIQGRGNISEKVLTQLCCEWKQKHGRNKNVTDERWLQHRVLLLHHDFSH